MAHYILDTNHLSPIVTIDHPLRDKLVQCIRQKEEFTIPTPVLTEFLYGIQVLPRAKQNMEEWEKFSETFYYREVDRDDAEQAALLQVSLRRRGWQLNTVDALIAAIALRYDLILLTADKDLSAISELKQENCLTT